MKIKIRQKGEPSASIVHIERLFEPEKFLERDKKYFAVVDGAAKWFFDQHLGDWDNIKTLVLPKVDESIKTWATAGKIGNFLLEHQAERSDTLLAVGGGVVLDTAGFAASVYMRGIPWIGIPTTMLAQVDASIGSKTAVNATEAKNIYGSFHPPKKVLVTPGVSATWNETLLLHGKAEMYKICRVFDHAAAQQLVQGIKIDALIKRSIMLKAKVVRVDPREKNLRGVLNYGHTVAHAVEHCTHMHHGDAVPLCIRCENRVSVKMGIMPPEICKRIDEDLDQLGFSLPSSLPRFEALLPYMLKDKKNVGGQIRLSLIDGVTELPMTTAYRTRPVSVEVLEEVYKSFCDENQIITD